MQFGLTALLLCAVLLGSVALAQSGEIYDPAVPSVPRITRLGAVAPNMLCLDIHAKDIIYGKLESYTPQPGETLEKDPKHGQAYVNCDGKIIGATAGPKRQLLWTFDRIVGNDLDLKRAMIAGNYALSSVDDPPYRTATTPVSVYRKSKPRGMARVAPWRFECSLDHKLYLRFAMPLVPGKTYQLDLSALNLPRQTFKFDPAALGSEAVHVNQSGFRPDDPAKRAYLSLWMGDGGPADFSSVNTFRVVDDQTGKTVYTGQPMLGVKKEAFEGAYERNHTHADVWWLDFADLKQNGTYRVVLDGIGCSYPFAIKPDLYDSVFYVSARGLYHQRSGIELKPPYTTFTRPRPFHPDDGVVVYQSRCSLMDSGNGLNAKGTDKDNFGNLVKGATSEVVAGAWGGYFDAGDWDRRIQHLTSTRYLLELMEMFPEHFEKMKLNIPETGNGLPDLVNEALWGLDIYRRLQLPDGGIRGGIEQSEHPWTGETSWLESKPSYTYAPDEWCSYVYAGDAARAALVLRKYNRTLADQWQLSAVKAFEYGEKQTGAAANYAHFEVRDTRCNASLELWRLTGDSRYHDIFLKTTFITGPSVAPWVWQQQDQLDATFLYARLNLPDQDVTVKANCRAAFLSYAKGQPVDGQGYNWTKLNPWAPATWGTMTTPRPELVRAHWLSGDEWYLRSAVLNCQSPLGANPMNLCYTVGLGHDWPKNPMICDMRIGNLPPFPGITVCGPADPIATKDDFGQKLCSSSIYPNIESWPMGDAYLDVFMFPATNEFTVNGNIAPHFFVTGYLAARK